MKRLALTIVFVLASISVGTAQPLVTDPSGRQRRSSVLRAQGDAWLRAGDTANAIAYFREAVRVAPDDPLAYHALATAYVQRGSLADALEVCSVGLRHRPDAAVLWSLLADVHEGQGRLREASLALRSAMRNGPAQPDATMRVRLARLARRMGAFSEALTAYRELADASSGADETVRSEARTFIPALEKLVGRLDPVRGVDCTGASGVRTSRVRALAGCDAALPLAPAPRTP